MLWLIVERARLMVPPAAYIHTTIIVQQPMAQILGKKQTLELDLT